MRSEALEYLACPRCAGALVADPDHTAADGHIMAGRLVCSCHARFPIRDGVPRLVDTGTGEPEAVLAAETARRFAAEWHIFDQQADYYEQQLLDWLAPLAPRDFADRVVLEAGCGKGRHTRLISSWGARAVVAFDLGDAVDVAFAATRHLSNVHVVQGDVLTPPVARLFDIAFSVGVLHHLPDPAAGFRALRDRVVVGGRVAVWVYGRESNEWILRYVDPVRKHVTSQLPEPLLYWVSLPPALALRCVLPLYRLRALARHLPYGDYLAYISRFPTREVHHIVFDQLVTPVAHYLSRAEVETWLDTPDLEGVHIAWHNKNSWRAQATVIGHGDRRAASAG